LFITGANSSSNQTPLNHLVQLQHQQKQQQFDNTPDSFFTDSSQQSYFTNSSNNSSNSIKPISSSQGSTINRPANNTNKQVSSFGNEASFMNSASSYHANQGYHQQMSSHDQIKASLPSVTPPMSAAGSSFFNNASGIISSKLFGLIKLLTFVNYQPHDTIGLI